MNALAMLGIALNVGIMLTIYYLQGGESGLSSISDMVGVMCGAITNTPSLGAAQQTVLQVNSEAYDVSEAMSMGYAAAYPLGVVGIIITMIVIKAIFKVNIDKEIKQIEDERAASTMAPARLTFKITNELVSGLSMVRLHSLIPGDWTCSRILKPNGKIVIPTSGDEIEMGDKVLIICAQSDAEKFSRFLGQTIDMEWPADKGPVVSRRILVTQTSYNGVKLGHLHLHAAYQLNVTRINRSGVDLLPSPDLRLQIGDRVTVVGNLEHIELLARKLGNSMKRLNEPNLVTMFIGIFLGILLGSLPVQFPGMSVPMKLGLAGGPLVVAILIGAYGHKFHLVTYTNSAANLLLREIGICLFLASVGIAAGKDFFATVFNLKGALWVGYGFCITVIPLIVVGIIARAKLKMNYLSIIGMMSGSYTDPPALAYGNKVANNDAPAVAYSTVYPLTMFARVIVAQIIVLCFLE